jgi:transposase-like protein
MPVCPYCYSNEMSKWGFYRSGRVKLQRWMCGKCRGVTAYPLSRKPRRRPRRLRGW